MTHLFLFTITPVQSFIMQARKTQDLWAGSRMLSDLIKAVINKIGQEKIIFPNVDGKDLTKIDSLSNRVLAEFNFQKTDEELKKLGQDIEKVISNQIDIFIEKAELKIGTTEYSKIKIEFEKQLKDYFSTFWIFVKVENDDYLKAYEEADRLLGAVKNSRTFTQNPEQGRKCSLSGEQNALVFQHIDNEKIELKKEQNLKNKIEQLERKFVSNCAFVEDNSFGDSEGLSAISYLKRTYKGASSFDSTAKIALLKDLSVFSNGYLDEYKELLGRNFDEQLYFEENLTPKYFTKHKLPLKKLSEAKTQLSKLNYIVKKQERAFTKYYAVLLFDADSMGAWLSGEYLTDKKQLYDFHKHISSLLSNFAEYAKDYVDGNGKDQTKKGRTVYAGGDDYLGFINLYYLFDVMKHLRVEFYNQVSRELKFDKIKSITFELDKDEMYFSAGISIAHYKTPLSEVLMWARKMEKEAKDTTYKNSFGVAALKKSGEIHKSVLSFKDSNDNYFSDSLSEVIRYISTGMYSSKFMNSLERELSLFGKEFQYRGRIMRIETKRLIENSRNKQKTRKSENENLASILELIYDSTDSRTSHEDNHFHTTLSICDFINRKLKGND
jgi:CRISPR-associated protein Cmr2